MGLGYVSRDFWYSPINLQIRAEHPGAGAEDIHLLARVRLDVEDRGKAVPLGATAGKAVHRRVAGRADELLRVDPVLPPAHRRDLLADEGDQALTVGLLLLAGEERTLIHAVHGPVRGDLRADETGKRREEVMDRNHLVARARRDLSRPLDHTDGADRAFQRITELAAERAVRTGARVERARRRGSRVVREPEHDGVVLDAGGLEGVQHLAGAVVELHDRIAIRTDARFARRTRAPAASGSGCA